MKITKIFTGFVATMVAVSVFAVPVQLDATVNSAAGSNTGDSLAFPDKFRGDLNNGQEYYVAMLDTLSAAICCNPANGGYSVSVNGVAAFQGGNNNGGGFLANSAVAEPSMLALLGLGMIGLSVARRRV